MFWRPQTDAKGRQGHISATNYARSSGNRAEGERMKSVAILGGKGGTTKTATSHLLCLGAHLHGIPACYVLIDPQCKVHGEGRPYAVLDGRAPEQLTVILASRDANLNGWLIIDGGGNRPEFDKKIAENVDLGVNPTVDTGGEFMR
jgi:chromosome partitioning protein